MSHYDEFRSAEEHKSAWQMEHETQIAASPNTFTKMELDQDYALKYFSYGHLMNETLRNTSKLFHDLALKLVRELPRSPERSVAIRKLLESKDAAVRANI